VFLPSSSVLRLLRRYRSRADREPGQRSLAGSSPVDPGNLMFGTFVTVAAWCCSAVGAGLFDGSGVVAGGPGGGLILVPHSFAALRNPDRTDRARCNNLRLHAATQPR
jgi:hypothetical protein